MTFIGVGTNADAPPPPAQPMPTPLITIEEKSETSVPQNVEEIAQCLTDSGAKFYGAFWCSHCSNQKEMFGEAVQYVDYIECDPRGEDPNPDACVSADITAYPTWVFGSGETLVGSQQLEVLAEKAGCN